MDKLASVRNRVACLAAALSLAGCGGGGGNVPEPEVETCEEASAEAWLLFDAGDFGNALAAFEEASAVEGGCADASEGLGWAQLRLGMLDEAIADFDAALAAGASEADPLAGKAVALRDREPVDFTGVIAAASAALDRDGRFVFAHDAVLDWRDLQLIIAQSRFHLGQYELANARVDSLDGFVQDPDSPTFVEDLLAELERLGGLIGGS